MDPAKAAVFAEEIAAVLAMKPEPKPKRKAGGTSGRTRKGDASETFNGPIPPDGEDANLPSQSAPEKIRWRVQL
jgi:hypothetical protein